LDANGPIAPQMSALRRAFRLEKPVQGTISGPSRPISQALSSTWNLLRCHGISSVNRFAAVPQTGSALHHLVTAVSVKKALMRPIQKPRWKVGPGSRPKAGLACPGAKLSQLVPTGRDDLDSWHQIYSHQIKMCDSSASMMRAAHTRPKCEAATGAPLRGSRGEEIVRKIRPPKNVPFSCPV
jgi:hypothetical protein